MIKNTTYTNKHNLFNILRPINIILYKKCYLMQKYLLQISITVITLCIKKFTYNLKNETI